MRVNPVTISFCLVIATATVASDAWAQRTAIDLTPAVNVLRSDGRSRTTITARVLDERGTPIADGTRVRFNTTAGRLSSDSATTQGGIARVTLIAADQPGPARITANVEGGVGVVPAETTVQFSADVPAASGSKPWIRVQAGGGVSYALEIAGINTTLIEAVGGKKGPAKVTFGSVTITADGIQIDVQRLRIRANGNVTISSAGTIRKFDRLVYDAGQYAGVAQSVAERKEYRLKGIGLAQSELTADDRAETFGIFEFIIYPEDVTPGLEIAARSIALEQEGDRRIQFKAATFFIGGQKAFTLPFHTMSSAQETLFRQQILGYGPNGVTLDFPIYYDVRPSALGTLHLRRGAQFGSSIYSARADWNLDLDQTYNGRGGDGLFQVLGLTQSQRGLRLQHNQQLGERTSTRFFFDSPNTRDLFLTTQLEHVLPRFRISLFGSGSRTRFQDSSQPDLFSNGGDLSAQILVETNPQKFPLLPGVNYSFNTSASTLRLLGDSSTGNRTTQVQSVGTRLLSQPRRVAKELTFTQSLMLSQSWSRGNVASGSSVQGTSTLTRTLGTNGRLIGSYDYLQAPLQLGATNSSGRHRLGLVGELGRYDSLNLSLFASQSLDRPQTTISSTLTAPLGRTWEARVRTSESRFSGQAFREVEYAIGRQIGKGRVVVYYSTVARRVQVDLTGLQNL